MAARIRLRLNLKLAVGPLHPAGDVEVFMTLHPSADGAAGVEITNVEWQGNLAYTALARLLKGTLAEILNVQIREALRQVPDRLPQVEEIRILEINNG